MIALMVSTTASAGELSVKVDNCYGKNITEIILFDVSHLIINWFNFVILNSVH